MFLLGESVAMLKGAFDIVNDTQHPVFATYGAYFAKFWPALVVRAVAGAGLYGLTFYPDLLTKIVGLVGLNFTVPTLPPIGVVALLAGLFADVLLTMATAKVPILNKILPNTTDPGMK